MADRNSFPLCTIPQSPEVRMLIDDFRSTLSQADVYSIKFLFIKGCETFLSEQLKKPDGGEPLYCFFKQFENLPSSQVLEQKWESHFFQKGKFSRLIEYRRQQYQEKNFIEKIQSFGDTKTELEVQMCKNILDRSNNRDAPLYQQFQSIKDLVIMSDVQRRLTWYSRLNEPYLLIPKFMIRTRQRMQEIFLPEDELYVMSVLRRIMGDSSIQQRALHQHACRILVMGVTIMEIQNLVTLRPITEIKKKKNHLDWPEPSSKATIRPKYCYCFDYMYFFVLFLAQVFPKGDDQDLHEAGVCFSSMFTTVKLFPPDSTQVHVTVAYSNAQTDLLCNILTLLDEDLGIQFKTTIAQPKSDIESDIYWQLKQTISPLLQYLTPSQLVLYYYLGDFICKFGLQYLRPEVCIWILDQFFSCSDCIFRTQACYLLAFAVMLKASNVILSNGIAGLFSAKAIQSYHRLTLEQFQQSWCVVVQSGYTEQLVVLASDMLWADYVPSIQSGSQREMSAKASKLVGNNLVSRLGKSIVLKFNLTAASALPHAGSSKQENQTKIPQHRIPNLITPPMFNPEDKDPLDENDYESETEEEAPKKDKCGVF